jgi:hypothetical protein
VEVLGNATDAHHQALAENRRSSTQEVAVKSVTVFQFEHVWRGRMVKEVLTGMGMIDGALNAML